jgi:hypothetical protein
VTATVTVDQDVATTVATAMTAMTVVIVAHVEATVHVVVRTHVAGTMTSRLIMP